MKKPLTEKQRECARRKCLNGVCAMTPEERRERKRKYRADVQADPFRREQAAAYFRKRRAKPGMRERTNEINRKSYHKDVERSRAKNREKYRKMMDDPVRRAEFLARRRERRKRLSTSTKRERIKVRLIPLWEKVVFEGRDEAYMRRTTPENARLFRMWRDNYPMFEQMIIASYKVGRKS